MSSSLKDLQVALINKFNAKVLQSDPYLSPSIPLSKESYLSIASHYNTSIRVFYLTRYFSRSSLLPLLTAVPAVCTSGDTHIETQSKQFYNSLSSCRASHPHLLSTAQRRLSRNKCLGSTVRVFARGGYGTAVKPLAESTFFDCIVISGAGPQFEADYLDYSDLILTKDSSTADAPRSTRLAEFAHFSPPPRTWTEVASKTKPASEAVKLAQDLHQPLSALPAYLTFPHTTDLVLDTQGFVTTVQETVHLWLAAFERMVVASRGDSAKGYFKLVSIGTGFFATLAAPNAHVNIGTTLQPLLLRCVLSLLEVRHAEYPHIAAIEFPDFSGEALFTPAVGKIGHVELVAAPWRDVLEFGEEVGLQENNWVPGVLNPGDCFALVGNEPGYGSVEAMIGSNSTLRISQNYVWNELVLDEERWEAVEL